MRNNGLSGKNHGIIAGPDTITHVFVESVAPRSEEERRGRGASGVLCGSQAVSHVHLQTRILASAPTRVRNVPTARALRRLVGGVGDDARGGHPRPGGLMGKQNAEAEGTQ